MAKNDSFIAMANDIAQLALESSSLEDLLSKNYGALSVAEKLTEQTGVIGEKIEIGALNH